MLKLGAASLLLASGQSFAVAICTTQTPAIGVTVTCNLAGTDTVTVPAGAGTANIVVAGAGGGAGSNNQGTGGTGARVSGVADVVGLGNLSVTVGAGGASAPNPGGGGWSGIAAGAADLVIAGGGGGSSQYPNSTGGAGAAGGAAAGGTGSSASWGGTANGGAGGSSVAPGTGGLGGALDPGHPGNRAGADGSSYAGAGGVPGGAPGGTFPGSGFGGAGYGGGGGGGKLNSGNSAGGGGGGSFADLARVSGAVYAPTGGAGAVGTTVSASDGFITIVFNAAPPAPVTPPVATPPLLPPLLTPVLGLTNAPTILSLSGGTCTTIANDLAGTTSNTAATPLEYASQSTSGSVVLSGYRGNNLTFTPIEFPNNAATSNVFVARDNGQYQVQFNCMPITVIPSVQNLGQLVGLLPFGSVISMANNGVLSAKINGVTYVIQPGEQVQLLNNLNGQPSITTSADGVMRFMDAAGNTQILFPGVLEPDALRRIVVGLDAAATVRIQLNGTAAIRYLGKDWVLVPDMILGGVPAGREGDYWWQEGPNRFKVRMQNWFQYQTQGFTLR